MTYAPANLRTLQAFLAAETGLPLVSLGIVGDAKHVTGYHCGKDRIYSPAGKGDADYSVKLARDRAGLTDAASAIDIGNFPRLRAMSVWLVEQCKANRPDTRDIREVIYSPDGLVVRRWDNVAKRDYLGGTGTGQGDDSHRTHTHISFFRDSEAADRAAVFRRYFAGPEDDMKVTRNRWERWKAINGNGVLRRNPIRAEAPYTRLPDGTEVSSFAEGTTADGNNWRLVDFSGPAYLLRADFNPKTPGGDPALDSALSGFIATGTVATDCTAEVDAARAEGYKDGAEDGTKSGYKAGASKTGERIRSESVPALLADVDRIIAEETA